MQNTHQQQQIPEVDVLTLVVKIEIGCETGVAGVDIGCCIWWEGGGRWRWVWGGGRDRGCSTDIWGCGGVQCGIRTPMPMPMLILPPLVCPMGPAINLKTASMRALITKPHGTIQCHILREVATRVVAEVVFML